MEWTFHVWGKPIFGQKQSVDKDRAMPTPSVTIWGSTEEWQFAVEIGAPYSHIGFILHHVPWRNYTDTKSRRWWTPNGSPTEPFWPPCCGLNWSLTIIEIITVDYYNEGLHKKISDI